jgi:hypothetical protein
MVFSKIFKTTALFSSFLLVSSIAWAQTLRGVVLELDPQQAGFTLKVSNRTPEIPPKIQVFISDDTQYEGIEDISKLEEGTVVSVEADKSSNPNHWNAHSVSIF